ncbi:MAG TPA: hypothetical protein VG122_25800 [Gemmata sp.]|jgi:hypothetical protein|nr:hypothetical protein [Gemmata sp.]
MDTNSTGHDDLNDFERRLAGWRPTSGNSNSDAMLFAAGFAAGRGFLRRRVWPGICTLLVIQAVGLVVWALSERAGRRILEIQLRESTPFSPPEIVSPVLPEPFYEPSPQDYFHLLRVEEQDPSRWLAPPSPGPLPPEPPVEETGILRINQLDHMLDI